ncbi:A-kinase anchor protein 1, mitochondrial [Aquila chrysaetos chrysaetos]|uniref:A-kinase anchoring protein 1 n=1 Tax=Aquila chrysaetos chrysaetos TaxID=223781 RepID=A0A663EJN5_AQUCH|nr:A-kinase anchor protein 1, mitochondrial [Aquila chrysaetos chrysaetos]XP_029884367.1 A-kinase anchor protein 1, mitochondrial [Aquila chrysaetos chrysaetos]XP_029884368.1 A-kinase anchor protein 1, mitochondrial [Aquila chrysaetos chrysaetos]XP_040982782.1 A-kinase anchor protein 1, mitochondrial [Aquila chrysaetos chrysaetos]
MALRFHNVIPYAIPGVLALLGCWWIYSHRKKHASYHDKQAIAIEEEQQEEGPENDSSPKTEACVPRRLPLSSKEECRENETSTSLLSAGSTTPSLPCQTHERLDRSQDLPDLSVMTTQPSTLEDDSEKLETIGSQDESSVPACVSLPLISKSTECHGGAAVSLIQDSSSSANQDQWPSASMTLTRESLGIVEEISNAEQSDDSSFKPPKESQMSEIVLSDAGSVTALCLGLEMEADTPQAFLNNEAEVVSGHKDSAVSMLPDSLESARLEPSMEEEMFESIASTVPVCQEEDAEPNGDELEREKIGGVSLDKEDVEKIEQVAIQIISKVILAATEEVLSGSASDVSAWICQAAASRAETPLEMASVVSCDQTLAEEATVADESIAATSDAGVPTSPQTEERDRSVTDSSCLTHGRLSGPVRGDTKDCRTENRVCSEEVPSGAASDASARICQAAASRAETPLETASVVSSDQTLAEEATVADESIAATSDAGVPTSPQTEERDRSVADPSCLTHGCLLGPVRGDTKDCRMKNCVCGDSHGLDWTPVENRRGSLEKSSLVMEDSGYSTYTSEGGTSVEDPLQNTTLSGASGQLSDSLSISATQDTSAEQSSVPSEKPPTLKLPEGGEVPYSNGILKKDGPDLNHECSRAAGMDGDHSGGSDVNSVNFVDSGCAMRKTVSRQNSKLRGESSKSDFVIWEIEVPKELVGRLIGKQGRFMSFLRQSSGAKIYVSTLPYFRDSQVCHIEGSSHQVEKVLSLIGKKFKELCLTNIYALPPPTPLTLHSLLMTAWLFLPDGVTVEVVVANQVDAGHMFLQQHTHPTFHVLRSLDQQMYACYSQPEIPTLPTPVEVGIICAAPGLDGAWLRAQVISYFEETSEVELRYVDYGGYDKVKIDTLRQIRSDFLSLPFQGAEVLLDNVVPLPDEDHFSSEADAAVSEMTRGAVLVAQVTNYDSATGLPLIQLWNLMGDEVVSVNRSLVERGFAQWLDY